MTILRILFEANTHPHNKHLKVLTLNKKLKEILLNKFQYYCKQVFHPLTL